MTGIGTSPRRAAIGVALLVVVVFVLARGGAQEPPRLARVERADLVIGVEVSGTLSAARSDLLGPPPIPRTWNFEISFMAPEGGTVEAGAPVLGFDTAKLEESLLEKLAERDQAEKEIEKLRRDLEIDSARLELDLAEAQARLRLATLKSDRPAEIVAAQERATADLDFELRQREVDSLERRLELKRAQGLGALRAQREKRDRAAARVEEIRGQVAQMTVRARHAGTVIYYSDQHSPKAKVGDSVWRARQVIEMPDLTRMQAWGEVDEIAAGRLAVGQGVALRLDAHPDLVYRGTVASIERAVRRKSETDPTKVFRLLVDLDQTDALRMRPGMRFRGTVEVEKLEDALIIPPAAAVASADGPVVYRKGLGGLSLVRPALGHASKNSIVVLSGLEEGDLVSLDGRGKGRR